MLKILTAAVISIALTGCSAAPLASTDNSVTLKAISKNELDPVLKEVSGLAQTENRYWGINDSGGEPALYGINKNNVKRFNVVTVNGAINVDWEDLAQDTQYLYIADSGDNYAMRSALNIYKVSKSKLSKIQENGEIDSERLTLEYAQKDNFIPRKNHNFDSEALSVVNDHLWLFSKNRKDAKTELYIIDKNKEFQKINAVASYDVEGLITAVDYHQHSGQLLLLGYSKKSLFGHSFIWLVDVVNDQLVWDSAVRFKVKPYAQWESIKWISDKRFILGAEKSALSKPQIAEFKLP